MTYDQWFTEYMSVYKPKLKGRTREEYNRMHRVYISPIIGRFELAAITPEHVQIILNVADEAGSRQAQAVYSLIHAALRRACRSHLIPWSAADAIDKPEHEPEEGKQLTEADYAAAQHCIRRDLALSVALFAGLRRGELAGLQWGDIDLKSNIIHVNRQRQRIGGVLMTITPKSKKGVRDIPIAPELLPLLKKAYVLRPEAWLFRCAPELFGRHWAKIQDQEVQLSQHYRLHDLRHTYGSRLILEGCNLRVVQYLMGHSTLEVTLRIYSHCYAEQAAKEVNRIYSASAVSLH